MDLPHVVDAYNCVVIETRSFSPENYASFCTLFAKTLQSWKKCGRRAVTITVAKEHAAIIPTLLENGFEYHHAEGGHCCLTKWIADGPSYIPKYPFTSIGVGAFIVNEKDELLLVKEMVGPLLGWKMPSGYVEPNESLSDAVKRELREETSLSDVTVQGILLWRNLLQFKWPKTGDMFFVHLVSAKCLNTAKPCLEEISEISWVDVKRIASGEFEVECVTECWSVIKSAATKYLKLKDGKECLIQPEQVEDQNGHSVFLMSAL